MLRRYAFFLKNDHLFYRKKIFNKFGLFKPELVVLHNADKDDARIHDGVSSVSEAFAAFAKSRHFRSDLAHIFFLFNYSTFCKGLEAFPTYNFYQIYTTAGGVAVFNLRSCLARWVDACGYLFSLLFYDLNPLVYSSPAFKKQTLALNWSYGEWDAGMWRYFYPFFVFQPNRYHTVTDFYYSLLKDLDFGFFLVTDCLYHAKNLFYFKKNQMYTVGLVNVDTDPAIVTYPIVGFFDGYVAQLFFFKVLVVLQKKIFFIRHLRFRETWLRLRVFNKLLLK